MSDCSRTVIDFGVYAITRDASVMSDKDLEPMAERVVSTLQKDGFCYLTNHDVKNELVGILPIGYVILSMLTHLHLGHLFVPQNHVLHMTCTLHLYWSLCVDWFSMYFLIFLLPLFSYFILLYLLFHVNVYYLFGKQKGCEYFYIFRIIFNRLITVGVNSQFCLVS